MDAAEVASLFAELEELRAQARQHTEFNNNLQGDGNVRAENGRLSLDRIGNPGPTGPAGPTAPGIIGPQGRSEIPGPTGPQKVKQGPTGAAGAPGVTGPTSPKMSVVRTDLGNVAFCPIEGSRPMIFDVYRGVAPCLIDIDPKLLASAVSGSLHLFSVTMRKAGVLNARLTGNQILVTEPAGARFTAVVAGIHRRFPDLDLPLVSDEAELRSRLFWAGEKL